jgi:glycosyltransferase involved in cell wall biosynthesis
METESIRGVAVHRLPFLTFWYRNLGWLSQRQALSSAKKRFRDRLESSLADLRPDVVITLPHLFPNVGDVVGLRPSASWKLLYAPMLHEEDPNWSIDRVSEAVVASDGVIALTEYERSRLLYSYGARSGSTAVVPPGVNPASGNEYGGRENVVLFIGRRSPSKRLDVLYEAMNQVWAEEPSARLIVAGSATVGSPDPASFMMEDDRVSVITSPTDVERDRLFAGSRVVVNPSLAESFGNTTLEAWAHGTPVVVADSPVNRSVVRHLVDGLVANGSNAAALAPAIARLLKDPGSAESMGREGRRRVETEFSWASSTEALDRLIRSI